MAPGSNEWEQHYPKSFTATPMNGGGIISSDAPVVTDQSFIGTSPTNGGQLTPTGSVAKPVRRRSRVSRRPPSLSSTPTRTTFELWCKQFTGCAASLARPFLSGTKGSDQLEFRSQTVQILALQYWRLSEITAIVTTISSNNCSGLPQPPQEQHDYCNRKKSSSVCTRLIIMLVVVSMWFHYSSNSSSSGYNNPMPAGIEMGMGLKSWVR
ncbi:hypothetical protein M0R45_014018 [Rubus argutus]|uniref:Uncharacterized protein n=1 Tax=Rubus argutus TaxID=59490 RepID=A0AAW1XMC8_RUBAR